MAFWKKKNLKGGTYYYIYESYYQDGKSKQRMLEYVGTMDDVLELAMKEYNNRNINQGSPVSSANANHEEPTFDADEFMVKSYTHGDCMGMYYGAKLLDIQAIIDECFPSKTIKGLQRSEVLILAMIQRAIDPGSKRQFANWASTTSLPYYLGFQTADLDSQAFWEAMDGIDEAMIQKAWNKIARNMECIFNVNPDTFHLDYSNYYTFIDSKNDRCVICKRGHNKQKRDDLRQFSLAVLTAAELQIPVVWELYEGNKNDKSEFADFIKSVSDILTEMGHDLSDITITFDGGSNSEQNFSDIKFHIVCPDSLTSHKELYDISIDDYEEYTLSNGSKRLAKRIDAIEFCGIQGVGILTFSQDLQDGKVAELETDLQKHDQMINDINERLRNTRSRLYTRLNHREKEISREAKEALEYNNNITEELEKLKAEGKKPRGKPKQLKEIPVWDREHELLQIVKQDVFKKVYLKEFVTVTLEKTNDGYKAISCVDQTKKSEYIKKYYGKRLTCTDHVEWSTLKILDNYCKQECIENAVFRVSKDVDHFSIRPQFHWTDQKIKVHVFTCLAAITIAEALRMKCKENDLNMTKACILDKLHNVRDAWISHKGKKVIRKLEEISDCETKRLWECISSIGADKKEETASSEKPIPGNDSASNTA